MDAQVFAGPISIHLVIQVEVPLSTPLFGKFARLYGLVVDSVGFLCCAHFPLRHWFFLTPIRTSLFGVSGSSTQSMATGYPKVYHFFFRALWETLGSQRALFWAVYYFFGSILQRRLWQNFSKFCDLVFFGGFQLIVFWGLFWHYPLSFLAEIQLIRGISILAIKIKVSCHVFHKGCLQH